MKMAGQTDGFSI